MVKKTGLCLNCLSFSHMVKACPSSACRVCGQKHHTMLHMRSTDSNSNRGQEIATSQYVPITTTPRPLHSSNAPIISNTPHSQSQTFATRNLISTQLAQKLILHSLNDSLSLQGVGPSMIHSKQSAMVKVLSRYTNFAVDLKFHILPEFKPIIPSSRLSVLQWKIPISVVLADPRFFEPSHIDVIIGAEIYHRLLLDGFIELDSNLPILKETVFGWIVSGKCSNTISCHSAVTMVCSNADLEKQMMRFWEIESCHSNNILSVDEQQCEQYFAETTTRDANGRFVVSLLTKKTVLSKLGSSREISLRRFLSLERRLHANPELMKSYTDFIREYIELGHMTLINPNADLLSSTIQPYHMPHHCVVRPESSTKKLRVVFDASCPTDTGVSLNDALMIGPVVQDDLYNIILRFRFSRYAIVADLEKMYRKILIHPTDRHLLRILWRNKPNDPVDTYELRTVTYGTASVPFLATRCLRQLAMENVTSYPTACAILDKNFYIDDLLCGVASEQEGIVLCKQLTDILRSAGFKLHKWASNSTHILGSIPAELRENRNVFELDSSSPVKTLGLLWQPAGDVFRFKIPSWNYNAVITKRLVLSDAARLFDPLGLVGPIIVRSKMFMQQLWQSKISWDCQLEDQQLQFWKEFRNDLQSLEGFAVPRWVVPCSQPYVIELHSFCDASENAYGACIYLRCISESGSTCVHLLTAESKVAPKAQGKGQKRICLPRLELSSALLLTHLYEKVKSGLNLNTRDFFWSDSMIVIHWLAASPSRWKRFVGNRVAEIQQITAAGTWGHVAGFENPADVISRGMLAIQLIKHTLWWRGPLWLSTSSEFRPNILRTTDDQFDSQLLEEKPSTSLATVSPRNMFEFKSTLTGLIRLVAHLHRFVFNTRLRNRSTRQVGPLSTAELDSALQNLVRIAQNESFGEDIRSIRSSTQVKTTSKLKSLSPILKDGILRARGRLSNACINYDQKQPMILDHDHPLTLLIVRHYHIKYLDPNCYVQQFVQDFGLFDYETLPVKSCTPASLAFAASLKIPNKSWRIFHQHV
ncbi:uncharacterized protein LOC129773687 [Toxorhynchites rutilus septentrionalis]|uniref:uncharacterized protein LOC129773687 n=1 Tax=Toxorhynchites rutilus septentrionalis TaxID=329112 RepID=UPI002479E0A1|nr:uncharacterized protein LOC129773687 [Toxorhynchites rutilus septentrionalis]